MKKLIAVSLTLIMMAGVSAQAQTEKVILSEKVVQLNVDISKTKLKLSQADYDSPVVKVLVPDLADVTILDHRNTNEGAPCMATYDTLSPEDVIQNNPSIEKIDFTITLAKHAIPNLQNKTCDVILSETINAKIRGFNFNHYKNVNVGTRHIDDCR